MAYRDKIEIDALYEVTKFGIRMEYPSPWVGVELEESENYVSVAQFCKKRRQGAHTHTQLCCHPKQETRQL